MLPKALKSEKEESVEREATEESLLVADHPVRANVEAVRNVRICSRQEEVVDRAAAICVAGNAVYVPVALGHLCQKLEPDGIRIGDHVAGKLLTSHHHLAGITGVGNGNVRNERVVDIEAVVREVAGALVGRGHGEVIRTVVALLVRVLVIAEEEQLIAQDGAAYRATLLVAVERGRRVRQARAHLALLVEEFVGGK